MKPSLSETVQLRLGESPWWAVFEEEGTTRVHVAPWDEANNRIAREHVIGECWCHPDEEWVEGWGPVLNHHEPTWPNSAESVN